VTDRELLTDLGIPSDYGRDPRRPSYAEAQLLEDVEPNIVGKMQRLAPAAANDWQRMKRAAAAAGIELLIVSGFRSIGQQAEIVRRKLTQGHAIEDILRVNAAPGFSEHHTGYAVDVATPGCRPLTTDFESSPAFAWLLDHAAEFDFAMPYGRDNVFGFEYEPWHWSQQRVLEALQAHERTDR